MSQNKTISVYLKQVGVPYTARINVPIEMTFPTDDGHLKVFFLKNKKKNIQA